MTTTTSQRGALRRRTGPPLRDSITGARIATVAGIVAVGVLIAMLAGGSDGYTAHVKLQNAGGLREGFKVRVDGVPAGKVTNVELGDDDVVTADVTIDDSVAPIGHDARATVRAVNLLGEKYLDLEPGDPSAPAPSGATIGVERTANSVELDDVIDTLDPPTRAALHVVLNEGGRALAGRGPDLAAVVNAMPSALDSAGRLLGQLSADNAALGRLVESSDRVLAGLAGERAALGRMVSGAAGTFDVLAGRSRELGATVRSAPAALVSLREALVALEAAAIPLRPAARGLRATAPGLTATLRALPPTASDASPVLRAARAVAPALVRLGTRGAPIARRLAPTTRQLAAWSSDIDPATGALRESWADILGVMEGWARSTAPRDAAGHIFRLSVGAGPDLIAALAAGATPPRRPRVGRPGSPSRPDRAAPTTGTAPQPTEPQAQRPKLPALPKLPRLPIPGVQLQLPELEVPVPGRAGDSVNQLLDYLLGP